MGLLTCRRIVSARKRRFGVFLFLFLLLVLGFPPYSALRAADSGGSRSGLFGLSGEELLSAEKLPPIDCGEAPKMFAKFGFPKDGSSYEIASWLFGNWLTVSRIPHDLTAKNFRISRTDTEQLIELCNKILALNPPQRMFQYIFWQRHLLSVWLLAEDPGKAPSLPLLQKVLSVIRDDFFFFYDPEDPSRRFLEAILLMRAVNVIGLMKSFGKIPPDAVETEKELLEAADAVLASQPAEYPCGLLYECRIDLLRLLTETDPAYAAVQEERRNEIVTLLKTHRDEILTARLLDHMIAAGIPDPPLTEEKTADIRFLLRLIDSCEYRSSERFTKWLSLSDMNGSSESPLTPDWKTAGLMGCEEKLVSLLDEAGIEEDPDTAGLPIETDIFGPGTEAGEKKALAVGNTVFVFCWCPPGDFVMGSPVSEEGHRTDEDEHPVRISRGFWMLETEVTVKMWESVMGDTPRGYYRERNQPRYPAASVSDSQALSFCRKLGELTGNTITLPTEAQWEYACRAGVSLPHAGAETPDNAGWNRENSGGRLHRGKEKAPNAWGLYDMLGNLAEWCLDGYDEGFYSRSPETDPLAPYGGETPEGATTQVTGPYRILRGGSWGSTAEECRAASRSWHPYGDIYTGFRVVLTPASEK